jgi:hypothetical protein
MDMPMQRYLYLPLALVGLLAAAMPAAAQERPANLLPTHDVAVTYQLGGGHGEAAVHWQAGGRQLRVDLPHDTYAVVDLARLSATLVLPELQTLMQMPLSPSQAEALEPGPEARFVREGSNVVAGLRCTVWSVEAAEGHGTVCLTRDGVLLSGQATDRSGHGGMVEAVAVRYAPQPQELFQLPADYKRLKLPNIPGLASTMAVPR